MAARGETVWITGSGGFLGQALAARLMTRFRVVGLDLAKPKKPLAGMETIEVDLTSDESVRKAVADARRRSDGAIASVIHLAAYYDLSGEPDPKYRTVTVEGTRRLLRALQGHDVEQFVFASTMLVHAPTRPGEPINEDWPLEPKWAYPQSKVETERLIGTERGRIATAILRFAGVYDEQCRSIFLAQQIRRIYERHPTSYFYAGDPSHGQPSLHLADLIEAVERTIERRRTLPQETVLLVGEDRTPSYETLQHRIGALIHGKPWPTTSLPKDVARAGAWLQDDVLDENMFIKPWMIDMADDHYELDIGRARALLDWSPRHDVLATLPKMIEQLKADPPGWYAANKLNAAIVAASDRTIETAKRRINRPLGDAARAAVDRALDERHKGTLWAHLANAALALWLIVSPFAYGLFDPAGQAPAPPAAGHALAAAETRNAWLALSEMASGAAILILSAFAMARRSWAPWAVAAIGTWVVVAPLVFWTTSAAAYAADTLIGTLVIVFAVLVPPAPGISREALASPADAPLGWSYSPSTYTQRVPIIALAFFGFFVSRYLAAYQLGHTDSVWDPVFGGGASGAANGTVAVITSNVSKAFPISDAGFGAIAYLFDILTGAIGDRRRWRTMPWLVLVFGLLVIPLGAVSVGFIIIQPTVIGALCSLCLLQAAITVILIPYTVDEVWATAQFLLRSRRAERPFWRTLFRGGPALSEAHDPSPDLDAPFWTVMRNFLTGGVNFPWTLIATVAIGLWLIAAPFVLGNEPPLAYSDHVVGCLAVTIAVTAMAEIARPVRFLNVFLGLWVAASPFVLAGAGTAGTIADVVAGLGLALLSLPRGTRSGEHYGGWDRYIV